MSRSTATVVLVHGAGEAASSWRDVQPALALPSVALDLLGRSSHPYDLAGITLDLAVEQAVVDIEEITTGPLVLVAHSIGGALSPGIVRALGARVDHLVHIAAVAAPDGEIPLAVASQEFVRHLLTRADNLRRALRGTTFAGPSDVVPPGLRPTSDRPMVAQIDSINLGCAPTSWAGVDRGLRRTFVRPVHDRLYPPEAQKRLAAAMGAGQTIDIDSGHNVARSAPAQVAAIVNRIVTSSNNAHPR